MDLKTPERTLQQIAEAARNHVMTPAERHAQRVSFIVGMTGYPREQVTAWLDKHEGR
jgi:hypothetical protein